MARLVEQFRLSQYLHKSLRAVKGLFLRSVTGGGSVFRVMVDQLGPGWSRFIRNADVSQQDFCQE